MANLRNRRILLGITGGIAAYKSAVLVRLLRQAGADVRVVMTPAAQTFITPLTLQALSGQPVHTALLDADAEAGMGHIALARWAETVLVAPASANFLARLATGQADDLLATLCLATDAPIAVAPAMNQAMWRNAATRHNVALLRERGIALWGPAEGVQACGDEGPGRMLEPEALVQALSQRLGGDALQGRTLVVTAGPTREPLDPVRYLTNHSSGRMGYALAEAARDAGASTVLISGPCALAAPVGVQVEFVQTAEEMLQASLRHAARADLFIAAAAVADYRVAEVATQKIKKTAADQWQLTLVKNPDIVAAVAALPEGPITVGFAAETEQVLDHARRKLTDKKLNAIIANDVANPAIGFNSERNAVWLIDAQGTQAFAENDKKQLARDLIAELARRFLPNTPINR